MEDITIVSRVLLASGSTYNRVAPACIILHDHVWSMLNVTIIIMFYILNLSKNNMERGVSDVGILLVRFLLVNSSNYGSWLGFSFKEKNKQIEEPMAANYAVNIFQSFSKKTSIYWAPEFPLIQAVQLRSSTGNTQICCGYIWDNSPYQLSHILRSATEIGCFISSCLV